MKKITQIFIGIAIVAMLGCSAHKSNTKDNTATQTPANCYTKQVTDADLYKFLEANQQNPSLNAVQIKVSDLVDALKNYQSKGYVYITITDEKSYGRNVEIVGITSGNVAGICLGGRGGIRCCPPPLKCYSSRVNYVQFFDPVIFKESTEKRD